MRLKFFIFIIVVILLCLQGCDSLPESYRNGVPSEELSQTEPKGRFALLNTTYTEVYRWIDPETGVEYLLLRTPNGTKGFSPRYGSDGKVIVHPIKKDNND